MSTTYSKIFINLKFKNNLIKEIYNLKQKKIKK